MNSYNLRPGITLVELKGAFLLVADREGRRSCPYVLPVNETGAEIWKGLSRHMSPEEIVRMLQDSYEVEDPVTLGMDVKRFMESLDFAGYFLHEEREERTEPDISGGKQE